MNENQEEYPGFCEGNYSETAMECQDCDIKDQCKEETMSNESNETQEKDK